MAIRTFTGFSEQLRDKEVPVHELLDDPAASSVQDGIRRANLDNNDVISGSREVAALWKVIDSLDQNRNSNSVSDTGPAANLIDVTMRIARPTRGGIWRDLAKAGATSIDAKTKAHLDAIERTGIGTYYGDHSAFKTMSQAERLAWIEANKKPGTTPAAQIREGSCIGWVLDHVAAAYQAVGKSARWDEIMRFVKSKQTTGYALFNQLQSDGWTAVHVTKNTTSLSGDPAYVWNLVKRDGTVSYGQNFGGLKLSRNRDVVNFDESTAIESHAALAKLAKVPFWAGMVNGGFHTFVGKGATVSEFHWADMPNSTNAIEETDLRAFAGSGSSIILMVPPGTWA